MRYGVTVGSKILGYFKSNIEEKSEPHITQVDITDNDLNDIKETRINEYFDLKMNEIDYYEKQEPKNSNSQTSVVREPQNREIPGLFK